MFWKNRNGKIQNTDRPAEGTGRMENMSTDTQTPYMIVFHDICKYYQIGDSQVKALDHANMRIRKGEFVSVIGPSGSGKSTLMNIIGCLDIATSGVYLLDGQPISNYTGKELAHIRNRKIGFIFQDFNLLPRLTAYENVELPLIYQKLGKAQRKEQVEQALNRVGLWERRDHRPAELSGGQQQRVAIARALAAKPSLFLADEPTGNLDQKTGHELIHLFQELNDSGHTILLITHDAGVAASARRSIKILDGHVSDLTDQNEIAEVV